MLYDATPEEFWADFAQLMTSVIADHRRAAGLDPTPPETSSRPDSQGPTTRHKAPRPAASDQECGTP